MPRKEENLAPELLVSYDWDRAVQEAVAWHDLKHPVERDAIDAALVIACRSQSNGLDIGTHRWPQFLDAVKEAIRAAQPPF